jgi:hypothetical protein
METTTWVQTDEATEVRKEVADLETGEVILRKTETVVEASPPASSSGRTSDGGDAEGAEGAGRRHIPSAPAEPASTMLAYWATTAEAMLQATVASQAVALAVGLAPLELASGSARGAVRWWTEASQQAVCDAVRLSASALEVWAGGARDEEAVSA